jgi:predicted ATPase/class 3 adenylate cyclase/DNA-binding CsgD family transcriptional regulator/tetratricopeptide (TPR) repeat protein
MRELPTGTVTLLFTDIEGSTRLLQQLGERYPEVLAACRHQLRTVFRQHQGHEVDTQGDSFFVVFARASDAVSAAVEAQRALAAYTWPNGAVVRVRIGLHTGEPQRTTEGYVGLDVHRTARIMSAGHGGQVLLSQTTRDLVEYALPDRVHMVDLGMYHLKDLQQPTRLFQLNIAGLQSDFPPLKTLDNFPNNLPLQPTPFIGLEKEVAAVVALLHREDVRLLTLTGPGGTGKTRLGLQVAAELSTWFADGVFFVNLAPLSDPELVIFAVAQALEITEIIGQHILELLKSSLREKCLLLLLDNFEHVASAAALLADLLVTCTRLKVLVTSREALHLRAEQEYAVPTLAVPDPKHLPNLPTLSHYEAVSLFIARAQAVKPDFQLTNTNAPTVAEICVRLDGLPLAIELAAARIKLFSPQILLSRLGLRMQLLTSNLRDVPPRQQTLRNTIQWSYDLLSTQEQRLFRSLSVFVGGCTFQAIEALSAQFEVEVDTLPVLDRVASFIDKNLLKQTALGEAEPRFTMLETIREFGLEELSESKELEATRSFHATYYLTLAEEAEPHLADLDTITWLERLEREHDNLRTVIEWSLEPGPGKENEQRREMGLRLGGTLHQFWITFGHLSEGRIYLERVLEASSGVATTGRAKALVAAADLAFVQGDMDTMHFLADEALLICRQLGDRAGIAFCLYLLGMFATQRGEYVSASSHLEESVLLFRELGNRDRQAWSLWALGGLHFTRGEYGSARACYEEALALFRALNQKAAIVEMIAFIGVVLYVSLEDLLTARALLNEALMLSRELDDNTWNKWMLAMSLGFSAELALIQDDVNTARSQAEEALVLLREHEAPKVQSLLSLSLLAQIQARQGNYAEARGRYAEILTLTTEGDDKPDLLNCLEQFAEVVATQGEVALAARLWGAAESLRETLSSPRQPAYRAGYERAIAAARTHLSEQPFASAWAEGRTMTLDQVLVTAQHVARTTPTYAQHPTTAATKPSSGYPASLTAREVEVLRLLAQGLTDAHIADHLTISPRTVNSHLTSIYNKIQVSSRATATRYAIEHQLV